MRCQDTLPYSDGYGLDIEYDYRSENKDLLSHRKSVEEEKMAFDDGKAEILEYQEKDKTTCVHRCDNNRTSKKASRKSPLMHFPSGISLQVEVKTMTVNGEKAPETTKIRGPGTLSDITTLKINRLEKYKRPPGSRV